MRPISILLVFAPLVSFAQSTSCPPLSFNQIDSRTTLIVAYDTINGECIPANYLILEGDSTSILLDTPWNNEQTEELLAWADSSLKVPIRAAIITHAHNDRMGGIDALHNRRIKTYIHSRAQEANTDFSPAKEVITTPRGFDLGNLKINVLYPGDGHAPGNLVVLIGRHGFYGGCFLKSAYSKNLGYTGDADIRSWYCALNRLTDVAERAVWIIPGHGSADDGAFDRTLELVEEELGDELEEVECD